MTSRDVDPGLSPTYWADRFVQRLAELADVDAPAVHPSAADEFLRRRAEFITPEEAAATAYAEAMWTWHDGH
jgi:hypothetical protein